MLPPREFNVRSMGKDGSIYLPSPDGSEVGYTAKTPERWGYFWSELAIGTFGKGEAARKRKKQDIQPEILYSISILGIFRYIYVYMFWIVFVTSKLECR